MNKLFTAVERAANITGRAALAWITLAAVDASAMPPEGNHTPSVAAADLGTTVPPAELPLLPASRPPTLQLLWFDPLNSLPSLATDALAAEVRRIFRGLGVEVAFRVAAPDATWGDSPVPEVPIILLKDDPIAARRSQRVLGLVVRDQEPDRAVWAFLENVRWTLGLGPDRGTGPWGEESQVGRALGRVVAHEVIHAIAPDEPHSKSGLMSHSMGRAILLSKHAPLEARCGRAFLNGLAARMKHLPAEGPPAALAMAR
jgi:hypothetical protein